MLNTALDALEHQKEQQVKQIVLKNRRIAIREVANDVGIALGSNHDVLA